MLWYTEDEAVTWGAESDATKTPPAPPATHLGRKWTDIIIPHPGMSHLTFYLYSPSWSAYLLGSEWSLNVSLEPRPPAVRTSR